MIFLLRSFIPHLLHKGSSGAGRSWSKISGHQPHTHTTGSSSSTHAGWWVVGNQTCRQYAAECLPLSHVHRRSSPLMRALSLSLSQTHHPHQNIRRHRGHQGRGSPVTQTHERKGHPHSILKASTFWNFCARLRFVLSPFFELTAE
jgi:hypothetical protein